MERSSCASAVEAHGIDSTTWQGGGLTREEAEGKGTITIVGMVGRTIKRPEALSRYRRQRLVASRTVCCIGMHPIINGFASHINFPFLMPVNLIPCAQSQGDARQDGFETFKKINTQPFIQQRRLVVANIDPSTYNRNPITSCNSASQAQTTPSDLAIHNKEPAIFVPFFQTQWH